MRWITSYRDATVWTLLFLVIFVFLHGILVVHAQQSQDVPRNAAGQMNEQCSNEFDPTLPYPRRNGEGRLGLIGVPCEANIDGHLFQGKCAALEACDLLSVDGKAISGASRITTITTSPASNIAPVDLNLLNPDQSMSEQPQSFGQPHVSLMPIPPAQISPSPYDSVLMFNNNYLSTLSGTYPIGQTGPAFDAQSATQLSPPSDLPPNSAFDQNILDPYGFNQLLSVCNFGASCSNIPVQPVPAAPVPAPLILPETAPQRQDIQTAVQENPYYYESQSTFSQGPSGIPSVTPPSVMQSLVQWIEHEINVI